MTTDPNSFGAPPRLAWIACDVLSADARYQRSIEGRRSQANIERICAGFNWALFGAATVAETGEGFHIIDGQHRVEAARRLGLAEVPCLLVQVDGPAAEARLFVDANRNRVALTPLAMQAALVEAGDDEAMEIKACCDLAGVALLRYPVHKSNMKPGQTMAVGTIRQVLRWWGSEVLTEALKLVALHWPAPGEIRAERIDAVAAVVKARGVEAAARALDACGARRCDKAADQAAEAGKPRHALIRETLLAALGTKPGTAAQPNPKKAPSAQPAAAPKRFTGLTPWPAETRAAEEVAETGPMLTAPVQRRCPCGTVFKTRNVHQHNCARCASTGRAPA